MLTMCSKAPDIYVGGGGSTKIQPVEFPISYELSFLPGHIPDMGQDMLDRCYCGFAGMCCLMYAGRALNVFVSAQECTENLSPSP